MQILTGANSTADDPSDLKSLTSFSSTTQNVHSHSVYQRLSSDPTKQSTGLHKVSRAFTPLVSFHVAFLFFFFPLLSLTDGA